MAFAAASNYTNLPNGVFVPTIYSKKAQIRFRKASVVQAITNTDYYGEISEFGDTVHIIIEPTITIGDYTRGKLVTAQDLVDTDITLTVDQSKFFAFKVDDIEKKQAHINWESMASDRAGYDLRNTYDTNVLAYMSTNVTSTYTLGTTASPQAVNFSGSSGTMTPLQAVNRIKRFLDANNVPLEDRWLVVDPFFLELLSDENSKFIHDDWATKGTLENGKVTDRPLRGFKLYMSNNLTSGGTGPTATSGANYGYLLGGHISAVATAEQIKTTETFRDPDSFADVVRGLHLFGRKLLRSDAMAAVIYHN